MDYPHYSNDHTHHISKAHLHDHIKRTSHRNRFIWLALVVSCLFLFSFSIPNMIYFNKIHKAPPPNITPSETNIMVIINGVFIVISAVLTLYFIYKLHSHDKRTIQGFAASEHAIANPGHPLRHLTDIRNRYD